MSNRAGAGPDRVPRRVVGVEPKCPPGPANAWRRTIHEPNLEFGKCLDDPAPPFAVLGGSLPHAAYRRKFATERKHLPDVDVAAAGAWSDTRALRASYQLTDEQTLLDVVNEPTKLRDAGAVKATKQAEGA